MQRLISLILSLTVRKITHLTENLEKRQMKVLQTIERKIQSTVNKQSDDKFQILIQISNDNKINLFLQYTIGKYVKQFVAYHLLISQIHLLNDYYIMSGLPITSSMDYIVNSRDRDPCLSIAGEFISRIIA